MIEDFTITVKCNVSMGLDLPVVITLEDGPVINMKKVRLGEIVEVAWSEMVEAFIDEGKVLLVLV